MQPNNLYFRFFVCVKLWQVNLQALSACFLYKTIKLSQKCGHLNQEEHDSTVQNSRAVHIQALAENMHPLNWNMTGRGKKMYSVQDRDLKWKHHHLPRHLIGSKDSFGAPIGRLEFRELCIHRLQ